MQVVGKYYTVQYAHLLKVYVKAGDVVTKDTVIGLQGGGAGTRKWESCSTGTHLFSGIAKGKIANNKYFISNWMANAVETRRLSFSRWMVLFKNSMVLKNIRKKALFTQNA